MGSRDLKAHLDAAESAWLDNRDGEFDAHRQAAAAMLADADGTDPAVIAAGLRLAWLDSERLIDDAETPDDWAAALDHVARALARFGDHQAAPVDAALLHLALFYCDRSSEDRWHDPALDGLERAEALLSGADDSLPHCRFAWARSWSYRGHTQRTQGTPSALAAAVESYDRAIALRQQLDLDRPTYRDALAWSWSNRGLALAAQGTPSALAAAVESYDRAIALREPLDLARPDHRHALAGAWTNRGNALQAQGTPSALAAAVESYDRAIALREPLDLVVSRPVV